MAVDFATWVYLPNFDLFARQITVYPVKSQPASGPFLARGIFDTNEIDVVAMNGAIVTDCRTELDIFQPEWPIYPVQGDIVDIPWEADVDGGLFMIADVHGHGNAGGELTCTLSRFEQGRMLGFLFLGPSYSLGSPTFAMPPMVTSP